jgi:hypothetical protein
LDDNTALCFGHERTKEATTKEQRDAVRTGMQDCPGQEVDDEIEN